MNKITINPIQARKFLVAYQGLDRFNKTNKEKSILEYFKKVGSIQYDPLDICGKNGELVLQARIKDFKPGDLHNLLYKKRALTEGWDKMMCIYSMDDYPFFSRRRKKDQLFLKSDRCKEVRKISPEIINELKNRGPLSSLDLHFQEKVDWSWTPTKLSRAALEALYFAGELAIESRIHTRKIYDLAEKLIPLDLFSREDPNKSENDYNDWHLLRRLGSFGLYHNKSGDGWLGMMKSGEREKSYKRLIDKKEIIPVCIKGFENNYYIKTSELDLMDKIITRQRRISKKVTFLAPLDNFMWDRKLISELFNFEYRWEVYKPVEMRKYGYYVLPILYGDKFLGRFEPLRDKKNSTMIIKNWWWEKDVKIDQPMKKSIEIALKKFAEFLKVEINQEACLKTIFK